MCVIGRCVMCVIGGVLCVCYRRCVMCVIGRCVMCVIGGVLCVCVQRGRPGRM